MGMGLAEIDVWACTRRPPREYWVGVEGIASGPYRGVRDSRGLDGVSEGLFLARKRDVFRG